MKIFNNNLVILCAFLFSLVIFSCNRDEPTITNNLRDQHTTLRNVYCDGQISLGIDFITSYTDPTTGECCLIFEFNPLLNACYATISDTGFTHVIQNPLRLYTPISNNHVTFCGQFTAGGNYVIYFRPCPAQNASEYGCMQIQLPNPLNCL